MEDYVDTFFTQLCEKCEKAGNGPIGAFLVGDIQSGDDGEFVYIYGAIQMHELKMNGNEYVIDESKKIENVAKLDSIDRVEFRVSRIKNDEAETMKDFVSLGNHKLECKLYGGGIVVPKIKQMFKNLKRYVTGTNSEISKFKVIGADDGDTQVIDLISRRVTDEARIGLEDGKVTIEAMMEAVTKVYEENKKELKFIRIQC